MTESLFQNVFDDMVTVAILIGFVLFVLSKFRKESMKDTIEWLKESVRDNTEGEQK